VIFGALDSSCFSVMRNPNNTGRSAALGAFRFVADFDYDFASPFFLLSVKIFLVVFFRNVQLIRTDDLHLLQFLTKPALNIHNVIYLSFDVS